MNQFASTKDIGLLKDSYGESSPLQDALKRKRERLAETRIGLVSNDDDEDERDQ